MSWTLAEPITLVQSGPVCAENSTATVRAVTFAVITSWQMPNHPSEKVICIGLTLLCASWWSCDNNRPSGSPDFGTILTPGNSSSLAGGNKEPWGDLEKGPHPCQRETHSDLGICHFTFQNSLCLGRAWLGTQVHLSKWPFVSIFRKFLGKLLLYTE